MEQGPESADGNDCLGAVFNFLQLISSLCSKSVDILSCKVILHHLIANGQVKRFTSPFLAQTGRRAQSHVTSTKHAAFTES